METEEFLKRLAEDITSKKELVGLNSEFVIEKIKKTFDLDGKLKKKVLAKAEKCSGYEQFKRTKEHDDLLKKIRSGLREVYGAFILEDYKKRTDLLEELKRDPSREAHDKILALHQSTKERLPYYDYVYRKIFETTGIPRKIVDLACGLNPISYPYMECRAEYLACDISDDDMKFIEEYFHIRDIGGAAMRIDLTKDDVTGLTAGFDVCFLFKALDTLEATKRNISRNIMKNISSSYIAVSFATKSIGGKKSIRNERRSWFDKLVKKNGWDCSVFELPNEIFYIIKK
jgi:16S rRNA (guanine(1405)-N(7))-methyltransferase